MLLPAAMQTIRTTAILVTRAYYFANGQPLPSMPIGSCHLYFGSQLPIRG